ncbi:MAG: hypothetical protein WC071_08690 [Victivallaceae bacterium]
MKVELQQKLFSAFPILYKLKDAPLTDALMAWGFCCGDGWFDLLWQLSQDLEEYNHTHPGSPVMAIQVKSKFGELCFYVNSSENNELIDRIAEGETEARNIGEET